jgi:hypothetical protein
LAADHEAVTLAYATYRLIMLPVLSRAELILAGFADIIARYN